MAPKPAESRNLFVQQPRGTKSKSAIRQIARAETFVLESFKSALQGARRGLGLAMFTARQDFNKAALKLSERKIYWIIITGSHVGCSQSGLSHPHPTEGRAGCR